MDHLVLGIESSCDETCASVVKNGRVIVSAALASSAEIHRKYGGVVPEIASREHLYSIIPVIREAIEKADVKAEELEAVGVTAGPGLIGSLLVGVSAAKMLAAVLHKPLIPVHHLAAHIAANYLAYSDLEPPFLALVVSGAHSHLVLAETYTDFRILGRTRDDAPGEAYDKIAREIGLGYPGGPLLDRLAAEGDATRLQLPHTRFANSLDFSFSGLKTAVLNEVNKAEMMAGKSRWKREEILSDRDIAASFQEAVCSVLTEHAAEALTVTGLNKLVLAGGVSANSGLRRKMAALAVEKKIEVYAPPLSLCTDNAAMVASQTYYEWLGGSRADMSLNARSLWELGERANGK